MTKFVVPQKKFSGTGFQPVEDALKSEAEKFHRPEAGATQWLIS